MSVTTYILGTLAFAAVSALLYAWGYRRSRKMPRQLQGRMRQLLEQRILKLLLQYPQGATLKNLAAEIRGVKVGSQLQGYQLTVDNHRVTAEAVLNRLVANGLVREETQGSVKKYFIVSSQVVTEG